MKYIAAILALLFFGLAASAQPPVQDAEPAQPESSQSGGLWIGIGPDMQMLKRGTYRFIFVPIDPGETTQVTTIDTSGGVAPGPGDPTGGLAERLQQAIDAANDADKAKAAAKLVKIYESFIEAAESGPLDVARLKQVIALTTTAALSDKPSWSAFSNVVKDGISNIGTSAGIAMVLETIVEELNKVQGI